MKRCAGPMFPPRRPFWGHLHVVLSRLRNLKPDSVRLTTVHIYPWNPGGRRVSGYQSRVAQIFIQVSQRSVAFRYPRLFTVVPRYLETETGALDSTRGRLYRIVMENLKK